jgi:hypothetical protein
MPMSLHVGHSSRSAKGSVFAHSDTGIVGPNPTQGMDVCICVYSMFVSSCM